MSGTVPFSHATPEADDPVELQASDLKFMGNDQADVKLPATVFDEDIRPHSYAEHLAAMDGPAFDPVHLLLRSQVRNLCPDADIESVAAICKSRHDLAFWSTMVEIGQRGGFTGHVEDLRGAVELLDRFAPRTAALRPAWESARSALLAALPNPKRFAA